jgi:hypothetical protein
MKPGEGLKSSISIIFDQVVETRETFCVFRLENKLLFVQFKYCDKQTVSDRFSIAFNAV